MLTAIRQWVIKTMMKGQTGVVQTLPKKEIIEMNVQITAERMLRNGINPEDLKSVGQVENVVNQIEQPKVNVNPGITSVKKADVLDMEGNKINTSKGIMGGKEINQKNLNEELMKTDNPYSELVNTPRPKTIAEREADVLAGMEKNNKEMVQRIRDRKRAELENRSLEDFVDDAGGVNPDDPRGIDDFIPDPEDMATGGRVGLLAGSVPKVLKFLKSKKKIDEAVNNIFPTGDYKYDAQMAADSLVENNPQIFGGKLYEDLDMDTQMEVYGAVVGPIQSNALAVSRMKKATRPEKTLASMKEGKGINMSDPDIADEFARFMKETDPKGTKELEQKLELENFKTKDRSENADGGRIGLKSGMGKAFLEFLKNTGKTMNDKNPIDLGKDYLKYIKDESIKGNSKKIAPGVLTIGGGGILANRFVGRRLEEMNKEQKMEMYEDTKKEFIEQYKNDPELLEIMLKNLDDRTFGKIEEKADGGRIGLKSGMGKAFLEFLKKLKVKQSGDDVKEFLSKRKFMKDAVGNTEKNRKARELEDIKKSTEEYMKQYKGYQFPSNEQIKIDLEKRMQPILNKGRKLNADGGRIGLKAGMTKRAFLKLMGSTVAGIGAAKSGLFSIGKGATKQAAKEVAQQTTSGTPPPYFFKLAEKIKTMGDDVTAKAATKDREVVTKFKDYELTEDAATGEMTIQRMKVLDDDSGSFYGNPLTEETYMNYKPGLADETTKGKIPPSEYEEGTALIRSDREYAGEVVDESFEISDDVLKEVGEAKSIKYASGGLAYMLGE